MRDRAMVEIREEVRRLGKPKLVPLADREKHTGFTSVYGYMEDVVDHIETTGRTAGLGRFRVYSDMLYLDFDNNEEAAWAIQPALSNYKYEAFTSGNRSIHFHIPIEPMYGMNVPYSQKEFVKSLTDKADMTIYHHSAMYRLAGTIHRKTGNPKTKIFARTKGDILVVENLPMRAAQHYGTSPRPDTNYNDMLGNLLYSRAFEGFRHQKAMNIALACQKSGKTGDQARTYLLKWNDTRCFPPKSEVELNKIVKHYYGD